MKRVQAACICQTLHFLLKEDLGTERTAQLVHEEVTQYKKKLECNGTQYKILSEEEQPDGSVIIRVIKQYNSCPIGNYLSEQEF